METTRKLARSAPAIAAPARTVLAAPARTAPAAPTARALTAPTAARALTAPAAPAAPIAAARALTAPLAAFAALIAALAIAAAAAALALAIVPGSAYAAEPTVDRIAGQNRYETAAAISKDAFPGGADTVIVATGENFPDALAASGLAKTFLCPVVLTSSDSLSSEAKTEIKRLGANKIYVVGGKAAVSDAVEKELGKLGTVKRLAGNSRYETCMKIYEAGSIGMGSTAIVATGANYPDALSVSGYAFIASAPIFLVNPSEGLSSDIKAAIKEHGFTDFIIVGGTAVVPKAIENELANAVGSKHVTRLAGDNRYATSKEIANYVIKKEIGPQDACIATGRNFPDALAGGPLVGMRYSVMLLADEGSYDALSALSEGADHATILGGTSAVPKAVATKAKGYMSNTPDKPKDLDSYTWAELKTIANEIAAVNTDAAAEQVAAAYGLLPKSGKLTDAATKEVIINGAVCHVRVLGFRQDDKADGSGKAGITFEVREVVTSHRFNASATSSGGWKSSEMRTWLNSDFYKALPSDMKSQIVAVNKKTNNTGKTTSTSSVTTTSDKLWLLSLKECIGGSPTNWSSKAILDAEGTQYKLFRDVGINSKSYTQSFLKKEQLGSEARWWLRSTDAGNNGYFLEVTKGGQWNSGNYANSSSGVSFCFCF